MASGPIVVAFDSADERNRRKRAADDIREFARQVEIGEITDVVMVMNNREHQHYATWGNFRDRWHILGAIEYAKQAVFNVE